MFKKEIKEESINKEQNDVANEEQILENAPIIQKQEEKQEKIEKKTVESVKVYEKGLTKSRDNFVSKLIGLTKKYNKITEDYFDELEEILIEADIGVKIVMEIIEETKKEVRLSKISDPKEINETLVDKMFVYYAKGGEDMDTEIKYNEDGLTVILVVGVNGDIHGII